MTKKSRDRRKARRKEHMETWGYLYKRLRRVKPLNYARHNAQLIQDGKLPNQSLKGGLAQFDSVSNIPDITEGRVFIRNEKTGLREEITGSQWL